MDSPVQFGMHTGMGAWTQMQSLFILCDLSLQVHSESSFWAVFGFNI